MEAVPFFGVAMPLNVETVAADPVEAGEADEVAIDIHHIFPKSGAGTMASARRIRQYHQQDADFVQSQSVTPKPG